MTNAQVIFLGACLIVAAGVVALPLAMMANSTDGVIFAGIAIFAGGILALWGWKLMKMNHK